MVAAAVSEVETEEKQTDRTKSDWYAIALDETEFYNLRENDKPYIDKIMGVYFFDRNEHTHLCELTPSYHLRFQSVSVWTTPECPDGKRDALDVSYAHTGENEDTYMHVSDVEILLAKLPKGRVHHYGTPQIDGDVSREDEEEGIREYYNGNCPF